MLDEKWSGRMNYKLQFLLICILVALACIKVIIQSRFSRGNIDSASDSVLYNGIVFATVAIFIVIFFPMQQVNGDMIFWAFLTGVSMLVFQISYTLALKIGPVSLSVLICNLNAFITILFCIITLNENVYLTHIVGMTLLVITFVLSGSKSDNEQKVNFKWIVLVIAGFLSGGIFGSIQKYYRVVVCGGSDADSATYLVLTYAAGTIISLILLLTVGIKNKGVKKANKRAFLIYGALTGVVLAIFQRLNMFTVGVTDGVFMMPTYSGLQSVLMSVIGVVFFKDSLSKKQILGIICGVMCVIFMNLRWGRVI